MRKYGFGLALLALIFVVATGGCGGGGGSGGGGSGSINGTWKVYSVIDDTNGGITMIESGLTVTVTRNSETGEIRLSGNNVHYDIYPQGHIVISAKGKTYIVRGVPSSKLEDIDESSLPEGVRLDVYTYDDPSTTAGIGFSYLTGMGADVLDYEVWEYKIDFVRN